MDGNTYVGAIAGGSQGDNTITNNYYVNGVSSYTTLNTTLLGIDGADVDGARLANAYDEQPNNIGAKGTQYDHSGVRPYANGLYYNLKYYLSSTAPASMNITLSDMGDNTSLLNTYSGMTGSVTLGGRTLYKDGDWNTICLPFGINDINDASCPLSGDGVELWQLVESGEDADTGIDYEGTLTLNFESMKDDDDDKWPLIAGEPYLIRWTSASDKASTLTESSLVFSGVTIENTAPTANTFGNNDEITFICTYAGQTFDADNRSILFLGTNNTLYYPTENTNIGAQRAYFQLNGITAGNPTDSNSQIKSFVLNFGEEASSIHNSQFIIHNEAGAWYDLNGRKLSGKPAKRGVYINNGKKVVMK